MKRSFVIFLVIIGVLILFCLGGFLFLRSRLNNGPVPVTTEADFKAYWRNNYGDSVSFKSVKPDCIRISSGFIPKWERTGLIKGIVIKDGKEYQAYYDGTVMYTDMYVDVIKAEAVDTIIKPMNVSDVLMQSLNVSINNSSLFGHTQPFVSETIHNYEDMLRSADYDCNFEFFVKDSDASYVDALNSFTSDVSHFEHLKTYLSDDYHDFSVLFGAFHELNENAPEIYTAVRVEHDGMAVTGEYDPNERLHRVLISKYDLNGHVLYTEIASDGTVKETEGSIDG